jgi:hypothetical protein
MPELRLPSLSLHLLHRVYACGAVRWDVVLAEGARSEAAGRHLVALELVRVERWPDRHLVLTAAGRGELYRRRRWPVR